jgi:hypothetical protein
MSLRRASSPRIRAAGAGPATKPPSPAALVGALLAATLAASCAGTYTESTPAPEPTYSTSAELVTWAGTYRGNADSYRADGSVVRDQRLELTIQLIDPDLPDSYWEVSWRWVTSGTGAALNSLTGPDWTRARVRPKFLTSSNSYRGTGATGEGAAVNFSLSRSGDRLTATIIWAKPGGGGRTWQGRAEGVLVKGP